MCSHPSCHAPKTLRDLLNQSREHSILVRATPRRPEEVSTPRTKASHKSERAKHTGSKSERQGRTRAAHHRAMAASAVTSGVMVAQPRLTGTTHSARGRHLSWQEIRVGALLVAASATAAAGLILHEEAPWCPAHCVVRSTAKLTIMTQTVKTVMTLSDCHYTVMTD